MVQTSCCLLTVNPVVELCCYIFQFQCIVSMVTYPRILSHFIFPGYSSYLIDTYFLNDFFFV